MADRVITCAVILRIRDYREHDAQVLLFTEELGKLLAKAVGVKKPTSRIAPKLGIGREVKVDLIVGRNFIYTSSDLLFTPKASVAPFAHVFCEAVSMLTPWQQPEKKLYKGLTKSLSLLHHQEPWEVVIGFLAFLLQVLGLTPQLTRCAGCHQRIKAFSTVYLQGREVFCPQCHLSGIPLKKDDLLAMQLLFYRQKIWTEKREKLVVLLDSLVADASGEPLKSIAVLRQKMAPPASPKESLEA